VAEVHVSTPDVEVPLTLTVGDLGPYKIGTLTVGGDIRANLAAGLRAAADELDGVA
jgi:hypothetical protein